LWLLKADEGMLGRLKEISPAAPLISADANYDPEYGSVRWLLALHLPHAAQPVPTRDIHVSFPDRVEHIIIKSFLTALKAIRPTPTICPLRYRAGFDGSSLRLAEQFEAEAPDMCESGDPPRCYYYEGPFEAPDLEVLDEVWSGLAQARQLHRWTRLPFQERFFAELDRDAKARVDDHFRGLLRGKGRQVPDVEAILDSIRAEEFWNTRYAEAFKAIFKTHESDTLRAATRIGRALDVFEEGVHLPELHAFLSMNIVLEILLSSERGEVAHRVASRLAKIVGRDSGLEERRDLYKRTKKVYGARSDLVHGNKPIAEVKDEEKRDCFRLTRRILREILRDGRLRAFFGSDDPQSWEGFLEGLDLG